LHELVTVWGTSVTVAAGVAIAALTLMTARKAGGRHDVPVHSAADVTPAGLLNGE
jgi:hypothetical protein